MENYLIKVILFFLYRGLKAGLKLDKDILSEAQKLNNELNVKLKIINLPIALFINLKEGKITRFKKESDFNDAEMLEIEFKSIKDAKTVLFGKESIKKAFCNHRMILKGDIFKAMPLVRMLNLVERYLFPNFITKNLFNTKIKLNRSKFRFYLYTILGI